MDQGSIEEHIMMKDTISGFVQSEFMEVSKEVQEVCQTIKFAKNRAPGPD